MLFKWNYAAPKHIEPYQNSDWYNSVTNNGLVPRFQHDFTELFDFVLTGEENSATFR
jgi:hypothetical protein